MSIKLLTKYILLISLFTQPVLADWINQYIGVYISTKKEKSMNNINRFMVIEKAKITTYVLDCTSPECKGEKPTIVEDTILKKIKTNVLQVKTSGFKKPELRYLGDIGRSTIGYTLIENINDKPLHNFKWYRTSAIQANELFKRVGLKAKTLGDSSYGGTSYQVKLPARAEIDSEGGCRSIYLKPETPWKEVGCLKHKVKVTIKKALPEKTKNRWGDEGTMIYVVSDTADGWMLDQYLKIKK